MTNPVGGVPNPEDKNSKWLPNSQEAETKGTFNADNLVFKKQADKKEDPTKPIHEDLGGGWTKVTNPDGTVKFIGDCAKGLDLARKPIGDNVVIEYINSPKMSTIDKIKMKNEMDRKGGYLPNLWNGLKAWGLAIAAPVITFFAPEVTVAGVGAATLTGCNEEPKGPGNANVVVEFDPSSLTTTTTYTVDAELTNSDKAAIQEGVNKAIDTKVTDLNNSNPKTNDGVGYSYSVADDGKSGSIKIDGTNIVLPFDVKATPGDAVINENHSLDLTTNIAAVARDGVITPENLATYINLLGGNVTADDVKFTSSKTTDGKEQITFANGFSHVVGEEADVKASSAVGQLQAAFGRLQLNSGKELVTNMKSGPAADESNMGIKYELKAGDLKDITTGTPEVKFSVGDIAIEGKVSAQNGVITITGKNNKTVTIKPEYIKNIAGSGANGLTITNSDGKKYEIAYDPNLTNPQTDKKDGNYCTIREVTTDANGKIKTGTETFFKVDGNIFDATTPSTKYDNLYDAYDAAVKDFKTTSTYHKEGTEITEEEKHEYEVMVSANATITWGKPSWWPW